jgi:hypothetical protein
MKELLCRIKDAQWTDQMVEEDDDGNPIHEYGIILTLIDEQSGQIVPSYLSIEDVRLLVKVENEPTPTQVIEIAKRLSSSNALVRVVHDPNQISLNREMIAIAPVGEDQTAASVLRAFADEYEISSTDEARVEALHKLIDLADSILKDILVQYQSGLIEGLKSARSSEANEENGTKRRTAPKQRKPRAKKTAANK